AGGCRLRRGSIPRPEGARAMRHRLEYLAVKAALALVRLMPPPLVDRCGPLLGLAFYAVDGTPPHIARRNGAAPLPGRSPRERRLIVRSAFAHFGRLLFQLLKFSTLTPAAMLERVEFDGEERVRLAHGQGKGVLFVTGHFGFWELQAMVHA